MPRSSDFNHLRAALHQLNLEQAKQLYAELGEIVQTLEQQAILPQSIVTREREVVETRRIGNYLYQWERVRCGKAGCKCAGETGELHGPYWYAYWREDGRLRSRYVGKHLRPVE